MMMHKARWQKKVDANRVSCFLCPRQCLLAPDQRGFCFIRQNVSGVLRTSYGLTSGSAIDPIEKKPLHHFLPGTKTFSFGTIGCNLGCVFCQNWHISKPSDHFQLNERISPKQVVDLAKEARCDSIAFTYNEPIISAEYVIDVAHEAHRQGIKTIAVTAGYIHEFAREEFFSCMDAVNIDLKSFSSDFYKDLCLADLDAILDTLIFLKQKTDLWFEITNLIIPGANDSDDEIGRMCQWIVDHLGTDVPLHFSAFHPDYKMTKCIPTSPVSLKNARSIAQKSGIRYVYTGNIFDVEGATTFCYTCKKTLIERHGYTITKNYLSKGPQCPFCHSLCPGRF